MIRIIVTQLQSSIARCTSAASRSGYPIFMSLISLAAAREILLQSRLVQRLADLLLPPLILLVGLLHPKPALKVERSLSLPPCAIPSWARSRPSASQGQTNRCSAVGRASDPTLFSRSASEIFVTSGQRSSCLNAILDGRGHYRPDLIDASRGEGENAQLTPHILTPSCSTLYGSYIPFTRRCSFSFDSMQTRQRAVILFFFQPSFLIGRTSTRQLPLLAMRYLCIAERLFPLTFYPFHTSLQLR
jgi:hypothetical protein